MGLTDCWPGWRAARSGWITPPPTTSRTKSSQSNSRLKVGEEDLLLTELQCRERVAGVSHHGRPGGAQEGPDGGVGGGREGGLPGGQGRKGRG